MRDTCIRNTQFGEFRGESLEPITKILNDPQLSALFAQKFVDEYMERDLFKYLLQQEDTTILTFNTSPYFIKEVLDAILESKGELQDAYWKAYYCKSSDAKLGVMLPHIYTWKTQANTQQTFYINGNLRIYIVQFDRSLRSQQLLTKMTFLDQLVTLSPIQQWMFIDDSFEPDAVQELATTKGFHWPAATGEPPEDVNSLTHIKATQTTGLVLSDFNGTHLLRGHNFPQLTMDNLQSNARSVRFALDFDGTFGPHLATLEKDVFESFLKGVEISGEAGSSSLSSGMKNSSEFR